MHYSKIFKSPNVLILILNRNGLYNVKVDITETIDITQFVSNNDMTKIIYSLYGVITLIGKSGPNDHYIASCKSPIDNKWYRYDDEYIIPISNIQYEILNYGIPYILFYQKNKIK